MTHSFKSLRQAGVLTRIDAMKARLADLKIEKGFNLREEGPELDAHRQAMLKHLLDGGTFPPIEVRVNDATGEMFVVDGHNRHWVYNEANKNHGAQIDWLEILPFRGNDVDRVSRIITSQEGKKLTPLEMAKGYKRLLALGLEPQNIADKFSRTRQHVDQLLILANANHDVHQLVASGKVAAATAVDVVRKHGEQAGAFLQKQLDNAAAAGKRKVTAGTMDAKKLPKKVAQGMLDEVDAFMEVLPKDARQKLAAIETAAAAGQLPQDQFVSVPAAALLSLVTEFGKVQDARTKQADKARQRAEKASQQELPAA